MSLSQDHLQWLEAHLGEDIAEWATKEAGLESLTPYIEQAKEWYKNNPGMGNVLGMGLAGAGLGGGLTAFSSRRPGEDAQERSLRILRNAAMGGLMGAGGTALVQGGLNYAGKPRAFTPEEGQRHQDTQDMVGDVWKHVGVGAGAGAGIGVLRGIASNASARGVAPVVKGVLDAAGLPSHNSAVKAISRKWTGGGSPTWKGLKGGGYGALLGLLPSVLGASFDMPSDLYGRAARGLGLRQALTPEELERLSTGG